MHNRQQWTAVYVGSLAARMATIGDNGGIADFKQNKPVSLDDTQSYTILAYTHLYMYDLDI